MEILVAILIIAVLAAVAFTVVQRRRGPAGIAGRDRHRGARAGRHDVATTSNHPMADAVVEHMRATEPNEVIAAEQRLQAQARHVAAGLQGGAIHSEQRHAAGGQVGDETYADDPRAKGDVAPAPAPVNGDGTYAGAPTSDVHLDDSIDPQTGERTDGYGDPNNDPREDDPRYDGRIARDYDPKSTENPEYR